MRLQLDGRGRSHLKVQLGWMSKMTSCAGRWCELGAQRGLRAGAPAYLGFPQRGGWIPRTILGVSIPGDQAGAARLLMLKSHGISAAPWFGMAQV